MSISKADSRRRLLPETQLEKAGAPIFSSPHDAEQHTISRLWIPNQVGDDEDDRDCRQIHSFERPQLLIRVKR